MASPLLEADAAMMRAVAAMVGGTGVLIDKQIAAAAAYRALAMPGDNSTSLVLNMNATPDAQPPTATPPTGGGAQAPAAPAMPPGVAGAVVQAAEAAAPAVLRAALPWWATTGLTVAGSLAAVGGGAGLVSWLRPTPAAVAPIAAPPATVPGQAMERVIDWKIVDGKFVQTSRDVPAGTP